MTTMSDKSSSEPPTAGDRSIVRDHWMWCTCIALISLGIFAGIVRIKMSPQVGNAFGMTGTFQFAGAPGDRIYIGDRLVGTGSVTLTWDELIGTSTQQPLAMRLEKSTPTLEQATTNATAELVAGPNATILWTEQKLALTGGVLRPVMFRYIGKRYMLQRQSGELDPVLLVVLRFADAGDGPVLYYVPIRTRSDSGDQFPGTPRWAVSTSGRFLPMLSPNPGEVEMQIGVYPVPPPDAIKSELEAYPLWDPESHADHASSAASMSE